MRYMLLVCADEKAEAAVPEAEMSAIVQGHMRLAEELRAAGKMVMAERLRPQADASRVRLEAGRHRVTDGPFAETKEALGGFYLIECAGKQEALEWARKVPLRADSFVEVRPVWQM